MALVADASSLPAVLKYSDLPATGPYDGYRVIVASLGSIARWDEGSSEWVLSSVGSAIAANIAELGGTLTGTVDGDMADVADIACAGGATPTATQVDTAVNGAILDINLQLKELQVKLNALIAALA